MDLTWEDIAEVFDSDEDEMEETDEIVEMEEMDEVEILKKKLNSIPKEFFNVTDYAIYEYPKDDSFNFNEEPKEDSFNLDDYITLKEPKEGSFNEDNDVIIIKETKEVEEQPKEIISTKRSRQEMETENFEVINNFSGEGSSYNGDKNPIYMIETDDGSFHEVKEIFPINTRQSQNEEPTSNSFNEDLKPHPLIYFCDVCSIDFSSNAYLIRHQNTNKHRLALRMQKNGKKFNRKRKYVRKSNICKSEIKRVYENKVKEALQKAKIQTKIQLKTQPKPQAEIQINTQAKPQAEIQIKTQAKTQAEIQKLPPAKEQIEVPHNQLNGQVSSLMYNCLLCTKSFKYSSHYTQHCNTVHSKNNFKCQKCGKKFENEDILKKHMQKHIGEKPFKCEICTKSYIAKCDLKRHMQNHKAMKDYICTICGGGFIREDHLRNHMEMHEKKFIKQLMNKKK